MNLKKTLALVVLSGALLGGLTACGNDDQNQNQNQNQNDQDQNQQQDQDQDN